MTALILLTFWISRPTNDIEVDQNDLVMLEDKAILNRALKDANLDYFHPDDQVTETVKVFDPSDLLLGTYTLSEFRLLQSSAQLPRANYLTELNSLKIYKVLE
jgi:hypothetical protein